MLFSTQNHRSRRWLDNLGNVAIGIIFFLVAIFLRPDSDAAEKEFWWWARQIVAAIGSAAAFAFIVSGITRVNEDQLFRECLQSLQKHLSNQRESGIKKVCPGGKLFDFIKETDYEPGDHIDVLWSYLQHEEVTERVFKEIEEKKSERPLSSAYAIQQRP